MRKSSVGWIVGVCAVACFGCNNGDKTGDKASAASGAPAAGKKKTLTTLTVKQVQDARESIRGNLDFAKHTELVTAKLGKPQKVQGDQSFWYGYDAATDDCQQMSTSATKGSGTQSVTSKGNCTE
jgi:hypothetical protein